MKTKVEILVCTELNSVNWPLDAPLPRVGEFVNTEHEKVRGQVESITYYKLRYPPGILHVKIKLNPEVMIS